MSQAVKTSSTQSLINHKITKTIADLSRLQSNPDTDFLDKYTEELNNVLDYVTQIQAQDTGNILPTDIMQTIKVDKLREDEPAKDQEKYAKTRANIIAGFPNKKGNLLVLPVRIIE